MKIKGFKPTGNGPKSGFSFSSKAGFSGSTGKTQQVSGYTRKLPHHADKRGQAQVKIGPGGSPKPVGDGKVGNKKIPHFAEGGAVKKMGTGTVGPQASGDSAVIRRDKPVTGFDAEHGGKGSLRPGFAEGGKVATVGAAIKMLKTLIAQGNSPEAAATKAASRYGVSKSEVQAAAPAIGGGGLPADKQMLAKGGMPMRAAPVLQQAAKSMVGRAAPARAVAASAPPMANTGFGSFRRGPLVR